MKNSTSIYPTDNAKPLCVTSPKSIPYAYCDKLKTELDLLQSQNINVPVTEATDWCAPIVATPKKNSDRIHMCVDKGVGTCGGGQGGPSPTLFLKVCSPTPHFFGQVAKAIATYTEIYYASIQEAIQRICKITL